MYLLPSDTTSKDTCLTLFPGIYSFCQGLPNTTNVTSWYGRNKKTPVTVWQHKYQSIYNCCNSYMILPDLLPSTSDCNRSIFIYIFATYLAPHDQEWWWLAFAFASLTSGFEKDCSPFQLLHILWTSSVRMPGVQIWNFQQGSLTSSTSYEELVLLFTTPFAIWNHLPHSSLHNTRIARQEWNSQHF
jgi:hypothetical protein